MLCVTGIPPSQAKAVSHFHLDSPCFPTICPLELKAVIKTEEI